MLKSAVATATDQRTQCPQRPRCQVGHEMVAPDLTQSHRQEPVAFCGLLWPSDWFLVNICWLGMMWWIHYTWSKRTGFLAGSLPSLPVDNFWTNMIFMQYSWIFITGQFPERWAFRFASRYHVPSAILKLSTASLGEVMEKPQRSQKAWRSWNTFAKHQAKHLFAEVSINFWNRIWKSSQKISSNTPSAAIGSWNSLRLKS